MNTFNTCQYEYFLTYIRKNKGQENVYSILGDAVHNVKEIIYQSSNKDITKGRQLMNNSINKALDNCNMLGISFPSELI